MARVQLPFKLTEHPFTLVQLFNAKNIDVINDDLLNVWKSGNTEAIYMEDVNDIEVKQVFLEIAGSGQNGVVAKGGQNITIDNMNFTSTLGANGDQTAILMDDVKNSDIRDSEMDSFYTGIAYYNNGSSNTTKIDHCLVNGNQFGIVAAPEQHPYNAPSTANTSTNLINLDITCNKLWENEVGIFGCGNLKSPQETSSSTGAGNNFDKPSGSSPGDSENTEWDILWQYPVNSGGGRGFYYEYWDKALGGYEPNSSGLSYGTYTMNGVTHPSCTSCGLGDSDHKNRTAPDRGCYANWQMKRGYSSKESLEQPKAIKLFPNPFQNHITIRTKSIREGRIRVMNMVGQEMVNKALQSQTVKIETGDWLPGTYVVELIGKNGTFKTRKMVKTQ